MTAIGAFFPFSGCQEPISPEKMPAICSSESSVRGLDLCTMRLTPSRAMGKPSRSFSSAFSARAIMPISAIPSLTSLMPRSDPPHCTSIRTSGRTVRERSPMAAITGHIVLDPVRQPNCTDRFVNAPSIQKPVIGKVTRGRSSAAAPAATRTGA